MREDIIGLIEAIETRNLITDEDVLALRRIVFNDGGVSIVEANAIFTLNDNVNEKAAQWSDFFMEGMTDFIVRQTLPYGYVDEANATWLIERISTDGIVETMTELRTLVNIIKTANDSTDRLVRFAIDQVKFAVLNGSGVIGRGRRLETGVIGEAEVSLLTDVLYACGGDNHIGITRTEADVLFDLNDACKGSVNHASWTNLFVKGIANYLMLLTTYETPSRAEVLNRESWLKSDVGFLAGFAQLKFKEIGEELHGFITRHGDTAKKAALEQDEIHRAEKIDSEEAAWLVSRIGKDGEFDSNEMALIRFLEEESPYLCMTLNALMDKARKRTTQYA